MANTNNPLSSMSYTNKDYRAIYTELLELVKKLTYKWDPTITNESDPGMILLKLDAIIGDKNNYNIDKNILEAFPETLTQEFSARSMYKQLAYIMPWYRSATTSVSFRWVGEELTPGETVTIPAFTMLTDSQGSKIFTLIQEVQFSYGNTIVTGTAIQGTITELTINGSTTITLNNIDYNNRIYLNDYQVAENGIYISNVEESNLGYWEKVDNLQIEAEGNRYFEFGIDSRSNNTYIEFPSDIETLIRAGLNIKYIISSGLDGNIASNEITAFYEDTTLEFRGEEINLNEEVIQLYNPSGTSNGSDPQSISDAYNSYRRVAGTFDTLVTLRDYINAIYQSELVSNDLVSDRLNDIQSSYKIITDNVGSSDSIIEYARNINPNENDMSPYDLKLYLLHNGGIINNVTNFNSTFDMEASQSNTATQVENYIRDIRCMQHNFQDILPNIPCMFRNLYPIKIKFVPQYELTNVQINSVKQNIIQALFDTLNSRQINFGEEPDYNLIYDTIINADERIKLITIDDFKYTTYATYWDSDNNMFKSIPISNFEDPWIITRNSSSEFISAIKDINNPSMYTYIATGENNTVYKYNSNTLAFEEYSYLIDNFRIQIITKSVLAGVTPLYNQETTFTYSIDQIYDGIDKEVDRVTTDLTISPWGFNEDGTPKDYDESQSNVKTYTLKDNESIQFLAPSFSSEIQYSNSVLFELYLKNTSSNNPLWYVANYYNFDVSTRTYSGLSITLYMALNNGSYDPYVDLSNKDSEIIAYNAETHQPGNSTWFISGQIEVTLNNGSVEMRSPLWAWQNGYITLYYSIADYTIPYNSDYKLKDGDYITFYWKESDEDDAPYVYRRYAGISNETDTQMSPIIRASFTINGNGPDNPPSIEPSSLNTSGTIPYQANPYSNYQKVRSMLSSGDKVLSGTKTIDIRRINRVVLSANDYYYYFITNNIDTSTNPQQYIMEFSPNPAFIAGKFYNSDYQILTTQPEDWGYGAYYTRNSDNTYNQINFRYDYTLKADEYFIHTNRNMSSYEILATGSLIRLESNPFGTNELPVLRVDAVAYTDLAMQGLDVIIEQLKTCNADMILTEQQIYNLTSGDTISITIEDDYEGMYYSQLVDKEVKSGTAYPYFITGESHSINGLTVEYSTASGDSGNTFTTLPGIEVDDASLNWVGSAILNLDATYDDAQIIDNTLPTGVQNNTEKQSLQQLIVNSITENDDNTERVTTTSYYPENPFTSNNQYNILTDIELNKTGGINIDVTYVDAYGERTSINIFAFELNPAFYSTPFSNNPEQGIRMNFDTTPRQSTNLTVAASSQSGLTDITVTNLNLEEGFNYILGIRNTAQGRKFWLLYNNDDYVDCLNTVKYSGNQNDPYNGLGSGKYYFLLDNINQNINQLVIRIDGNANEGYLQFDNLTKCVENEIFEQNYGIKPEQIAEQLPIYDYNGYFQYNYQVPVDKYIEDPLESSSFFNENHVCNGYTIAQVSLNFPSDKNKNIKASSIDIINNR